MALPLAAKIAAGLAGGAGLSELMMSDNRPEREKIKKMMSDRPGKKMGEAAVKNVIAEEMQYEAPDDAARKRISEKAAQAGREAEDEVKREMRGHKKGGYVRAADGIAKRGKTRGRMI